MEDRVETEPPSESLEPPELELDPELSFWHVSTSLEHTPHSNMFDVPAGPTLQVATVESCAPQLTHIPSWASGAGANGDDIS